VLQECRVQEFINSSSSNTVVVSEDQSVQQVQRTLRSELDTLLATKTFRPWSATIGQGKDKQPSFQDENIADALQEILQHAPVWVQLLNNLIVNERADRPTYSGPNTPSEAHSRLLYLLTSMVMGSRAKKRANSPLVRLGLYLEANGTKERVVTTLARFGICPSIHSIRDKIKDIEEYSKVTVPSSSIINT
jgi:hypothetical protein